MGNQAQPNIIIFLLLMFLGCSMHFAADIYAPSLPSVAKSLQSSINDAQYSMSIYMLGVALSVLFYGSMSEVYGRKKPMIIGITIMLLGTYICYNASDIESLILGRLIQGIGAGGPASLWRAIFRDCYSGDELAKYSSYAVLVVIFILPTAPVIGGFLDDYFSWRANFIFLGIYFALGVLGALTMLPETGRNHSKYNLNLTNILKQYIAVLKNRIFLGATLAIFFVYGAFFSIMVISPILLIERIGISASEFGLLIGLGGGFMVALAGIINGKIVNRFGAKNMLNFGVILALICSLFIILLYMVNGLEFYSIVIPILIMDFGIMFVFPNAFAVAMTPFDKNAGYAGALYSFLQILGGGILGTFLSNFPDDNQLILGLVTLLCLSLSLLSLRLFLK